MNKITAPSTLQQRIVAVLGNASASAAELAECIADTEQAIVEADEVITRERASAADLISTPSGEAAEQAISRAEAAKINRDRLNGILPKLKARLAASLESERHDRWLSEYCKAKAERDAVAAEFADNYPRLVAELVGLFCRMQQCDQKSAEVDTQASNLNNEHRRLGKVELCARGLANFSRSDPEIAKVLSLPDLDHSDQMAWPPKQPSMAAAFAQSMVVPHPGAAWSTPEERERRRVQAETENTQMAAWHESATASENERINRQEAERFRQAHPQQR